MSSSHGTAAASTSNFMSIRQAISGPSPPPSYARLVKAVLRYRQKRVYGLAAAGVAVILPLAAFPVAGFDACIALVYPTVWIFVALGFCGTLPVFIARKQYLSTTKPAYADRFSHYSTLATSRQARLTLAAYWLGAAFIVSAYACIVTWLAPSRSYLVLTRTPGRDLLQVNERLIYTALAIYATVTSYAAVQLLSSRHVLAFDDSSAPIPARLQARFLSKIYAIPAQTGPVNLTLLGLYLLFRRTALRIVIYRIPGGRALRPYLISMLRHNALSASVILSALFASTAAVVILELANSLADIYFSQQVAVSSYSSEPQRTLIDGLQCAEHPIRHFAYLELRKLVAENEQRRKEIFSDLKGKSWESISGECLKQLEQSYRVAQRRGQPAPTSSSPSAGSGTPSSSGASRPSASQGSRIPISQEPGFRPTQRTFLDTVADAPGLVNNANVSVTIPASATQLVPASVSNATSTAIAKVPAIFQRQVVARVPENIQQEAVHAKEEVQKVAQTAMEKWKSLTPALVKQTPYWRYLFDADLLAEVSKTVPDLDLDRWAASALAGLVMASLQEDRYGVAQADIPKILEGLVTYLSTLESYTKELNQLADDGKFPSAVVRTAVSGSIQPLVDALRDGIAGIAHTFRAYLDDLKLPPSVATRVKGFL